MSTRVLSLVLNGAPAQAVVDPRKTLADVLRDDFGLVGTKLGCEHGVCGACTVLMDGAAVRSCLLFAVQSEGRAVDTVEGLSDNGDLGDVQEAFRRHHAVQCGFCTPGLLMSVTDYLRDADPADDDELREALSGNICRCTGYQGIVDAVKQLVDDRRSADAGD